MKAVIQRVSQASVTVNGNIVGQIKQGLCCLVGIATDDTESDIDYIVKKITTLRLFEKDSKMWNANVGQIGGGILCISQFTLLARTRKGTKPDFNRCMKTEQSAEFWKLFMTKMRESYNLGNVSEGQFGAMMSCEIINDGPVTISIDSKVEKESKEQ
jgi:D-tyrosyl-tRNA(Tyr) deacylase